MINQVKISISEQNIGVHLGFTPDEQQGDVSYSEGSDNKMSSERPLKCSIMQINEGG